ncbi:MAG: thioredoxin family protein [Verrucomicrobiae bacterium]
MNRKTITLIIIVAFSGIAGAQERGAGPAGSAKSTTQKLPRLVDLGASKCIPCKMMAPILEALKTEYEGRMDVEFIDVWKSPEAGKEYGIRIIPTQIFYGADGKEAFRHEGFFGKDDILAKWKELKVELKGPPIPEASGSTSPHPPNFTPAK